MTRRLAETSDGQPDYRTARVCSTDEKRLGVCIFLTGTDLSDLGVEPSSSEVVYRVDSEEGEIRLQSRDVTEDFEDE